MSTHSDFCHAQWTIRFLLEHGLSVRGAVRSIEKGADLREIFAEYGHGFELVVVPDITAVHNSFIVPVSPWSLKTLPGRRI